MTDNIDQSPMVVFCDTENTVIDEAYAEKVIVAFRELTGWKVEPGTRIDNDLREFSKGYSVKKRNPLEVAAIFKIANRI